MGKRGEAKKETKRLAKAPPQVGLDKGDSCNIVWQRRREEGRSKDKKKRSNVYGNFLFGKRIGGAKSRKTRNRGTCRSSATYAGQRGSNPRWLEALQKKRKSTRTQRIRRGEGE